MSNEQKKTLKEVIKEVLKENRFNKKDFCNKCDESSKCKKGRENKFRCDFVIRLKKNNYKLEFEPSFEPIDYYKFYPNNICWKNDNIDWLTTIKAEYLEGIKVDLFIENEKNKNNSALIELKVIDTKNNEHCKFIFGLENFIEKFRGVPDPTNLKRLCETTKPVYEFKKHNFLTFFHEGQIWNDIVRLLAVKEQFDVESDPDLFLVGIIEKKQRLANNPKVKQYVENKLKDIIAYLKKNKVNNEYRVINADTNFSSVWMYYAETDFEADIEVIDIPKNNDWIGYVIQIKPKTDES